MKKWVPLLIMVYFLLGTIYSLEAQMVPIKQWDKTIGGSDYDRLFSIQQTADGGYIVGGDSESFPSGDRSAPTRGGLDYWVVKLNANGNKTWDKAYGTIGYDRLNYVQQTFDGGYIAGGWAPEAANGDKSQGYNGYSDYWIVKLDGNGNKVWDKTFGGNLGDNLWAMQQTSDSGYILGGESISGISFDKTQNSRGSWDFWVVKLDSNGTKVWDKTFGGSGDDELFSLHQTQDGGYILGGWAKSGQNGDKSEPNKGQSFIPTSDYWVIKLDSNGNKIWDKTFGGDTDDFLYSIQQTSDGSFILGGWSDSNLSGDKSQSSNGGRDYWVLKIDSSGNKLWDKTFGGNGNDELYTFRQTSDGNYLLGGWSNSGISANKSQPSKGGSDFWIIKTDTNGNKIWDVTFGGSADELLYSLQETSDKGFILGGWSYSGISGDKSEPSRGSIDFWIIKIIEPCNALKAVLQPSCKDGQTNVSVNISGIQPDSSGNPFWTLVYTRNGVRQTVDGTASSFVLENNVVPGTIFSLVSIVSGICSTTLSSSITVQDIPDNPEVAIGNFCGVSEIMLNAAGAPEGGGYTWYNSADGGAILHTSTSGTFVTSNLNENTTYYVSAKNNAGCEGLRSPVKITYENCPKPFIPNIITQNHDTKNDTFKPQNLPTGKWQLQVYNRWGVKIYEAKDYQNNWPENEIANSTYYYLLSNAETGKQFKGWLEVTE